MNFVQIHHLGQSIPGLTRITVVKFCGFVVQIFLLLTPGGVTCYQLFNLMPGLAGKGALVGMYFLEVVSEYNVAKITSLFAARLILNFIGLAARSSQFSR